MRARKGEQLGPISIGTQGAWRVQAAGVNFRDVLTALGMPDSYYQVAA